MAVTRASLPAILCCLGLTSAFALPTSRILDGDDAVIGQFPWTASVRVSNTHAAGGVIISNKHILTAASAVSDIGTVSVDVASITVRVGSINQYAGGKIVNVESVTIHPTYGSFIHNLAILTLAESLSFDDKIASIPYAAADAEIAVDSEVAVAGWGIQKSGTAPYKLQHTTMGVMSAAECEYEAGYGYESVMCLNHELDDGIGAGDAGDAVVQNGVLVGVASFAFGAGGTKYPDVSSRVSYYADWIDATIADAAAL